MLTAGEFVGWCAPKKTTGRRGGPRVRSLTSAQAKDIRKLAAEGMGVRAIARKYDVSPGTISYIVSGKTYKRAI